MHPKIWKKQYFCARKEERDIWVREIQQIIHNQEEFNQGGGVDDLITSNIPEDNKADPIESLMIAPRKAVKLTQQLDGDSIIKEFIHGIGKRNASPDRKEKDWKEIAKNNSRSNMFIDLNKIKGKGDGKQSKQAENISSKSAYHFSVEGKVPNSVKNQEGANYDMLGVYDIGRSKSKLDLLTDRFQQRLRGIGKHSKSTRDIQDVRSYSSSESPFKKILTERSVKKFTNSNGKKVKRTVSTYKVAKMPRSMSNSSITSIYSRDSGKQNEYCLRQEASFDALPRNFSNFDLALDGKKDLQLGIGIKKIRRVTKKKKKKGTSTSLK